MRKVLVLGAGAAGYAAAQTLTGALSDRPGVELTLLSDRSNYVLRPLLPDVAVGRLPAQLAAIELDRLSTLGPICIQTERIQTIDIEARVVSTDRAAYNYDYLLLALGQRPTLPPESDDTNVNFCQTDADANRLHIAVERLGQPRGSNEVLGKVPSVVIVGGGSLGVHLAGSLADATAATSVAGRRPVRLILVETKPRLLPSFPQEFGSYAAQILDGLGVVIETHRAVLGVRGGRVSLDNGDQLTPDLVIWTAQNTLSPCVTRLTDSLGALPTDPFLRLSDSTQVFVAGSAAAPPELPTYGWRPGDAVRSGITAAKNLLAAMSGRSLEPFRHEPYFVAAPVGQGRAYAHVLGIPSHGAPAWVLYRASLARQLPSLMDRVAVLTAWTNQFFAR